MKVTLSIIKADVGSIGGHTMPSEEMVAAVRERLSGAIRSGTVIDGRVTYTGDDIAMIMSHTKGPNKIGRASCRERVYVLV